MTSTSAGYDALRNPQGWCSNCPDHEACATGAPCDYVKSVDARQWALRGSKGPTVIGDEGHERDRLPDDAEPIGGNLHRDSEGGIWTVIPEADRRWAQRGGQYRRRLRRLYERARHG